MKDAIRSTQGKLKVRYRTPSPVKGSPPKTENITGSEAVMRSLLAEGVDTIFGYPGGAIMPVYDALFNYESKLKHILTRHEQGAIHAAQGYARISGKPGVCLATSGPGATNLMTGLADAYIDSTPLVCITGQVTSQLLGTDAFQETDVIGITTPVTKWNFQVTSADEIPSAIANAFYIARSGRPGPVVLDITKDAQFASLDFAYKPAERIRSYRPKPVLDPKKLREAAALINSAKKPMILFGQGVLLSGAEERLREFVEKTGIPAAWTLLGHSAIRDDHPLNVGMLGMHGNYAPNLLTNECDLLVAVGMRFDDRVTGKVDSYARQAKVIHIEIDDAEIDKIIKADVPIHGDAAEALTHLTPLVEEREHKEWRAKFDELYEIEYNKVIREELTPAKEGLTMGEVIRGISEKAVQDAVVVTDVGQHQMATARYYKHLNPKTAVTSGGLGTMGFCLPASMGCQLADPEKQVIAFIGDGGFQMTIQELGTIMQYKIPVKIVVLNNNFLGMVRQWQQLFFEKRYASTEMTNPDFIRIASGYGINGQKVTERKNLGKAIDEMLAADGPYLLEVAVEKENNVFPMVPSGASVSDIRLD